MPRTKKVVSKRMAALLEKKATLKAVCKEHKKAYGVYAKADNALYAVEDKIRQLTSVEAAKAAK
jgi:hypothetical protein